jgi:hypothetical protein
MKRNMLLGILLITLAGCAPFKEAYYLDEEFGKDSRAAWEEQIVQKDPLNIDTVPEGMTGITAEGVMGVRNQTFAEKPTKSKIFEFGLGGSK